MSFLLCLFLSFTAAASSGQLDDLPKPTSENLKWIIPFSDWDNKESYFIKGDIFRMSIDAQTRRKTPNGEELVALDVFDSPDAKTSVKISLNRDRIYGPNSEILCQKTPTQHPIISNTNMKCEGGGCAPNMYDGPVDINYENLLTMDFMSPSKGKCSISINFSSYHLENDEGLYFKFVSLTKDKKFLEILLNGNPAFLNIEKCQFGEMNKSKICEFHKLTHSRYEQNWINLKNIQKNKSHAQLNSAIKFLKPCVENKDIACAEKFISRSGAEEDPMFLETVITADIFDELSECLDYKNLLPHLMASKGKNKICIFNRESDFKPLLGVNYLETLGGGRVFKLNPKDIHPPKPSKNEE